jgi:hypothetical protein
VDPFLPPLQLTSTFAAELSYVLISITVFTLVNPADLIVSGLDRITSCLKYIWSRLYSKMNTNSFTLHGSSLKLLGIQDVKDGLEKARKTDRQ